MFTLILAWIQAKYKHKFDGLYLFTGFCDLAGGWFTMCWLEAFLDCLKAT